MTQRPARVCVCDDPQWHVKLYLANDAGVLEVTEELLIDFTVMGPDAAESAGDLGLQHAQMATTSGRDWRVDIRCPKCHGGTVITPEAMHDIIGVKP